jgi:hypothetical protein
MGKEGFHNVFGDRPIKWLIAKKKTPSKQSPTIQSIWICKNVWSLKVYDKNIYKIINIYKIRALSLIINRERFFKNLPKINK